MSGIEIIMSLVSALSLSEKLQLNAALATSMAGKEVSSRKGKPAAPGTKAWTAFVTHVQSTMPERFAPPAAPKDRMVIAKAIKDEDPAAYKSFCEQYVSAHPAPAESDAETVAPLSASASVAASASASAEKPKRVISEEQKAKMKAGREKAAAAKKEAIAAGTVVPKAKAKAEKAKPAPKAKAEPKAESAPAPKASVGGSGSAPAPAVEEDTGMEKIKIGGDLYYLCTANNNLYSVEPDGLGAYVGRYQPGSDDEIDFEADEAE
jgi:ribonuclease E